MGTCLIAETSYRPSTAGERFRSYDGNVEPDEIRMAGSRVVLPEGKLIVPGRKRSATVASETAITEARLPRSV